MFVSRRMLRRADAEEDLYAGFDEEAHPAFDTQTLAVDEAFQQAVQSSHGRGPPTSSGSTTAFRLATARGSAAMRRGGKGIWTHLNPKTLVSFLQDLEFSQDWKSSW